MLNVCSSVGELGSQGIKKNYALCITPLVPDFLLIRINNCMQLGSTIFLLTVAINICFALSLQVRSYVFLGHLELEKLVLGVQLHGH